MANTSPSSLSEHDLLAETKRVAAVERCATAALLALLAEVDSRQSYMRLGFNSLFAYCTKTLLLSEPAAYSRITVARLTPRFPVILSLIDQGALSLTTVGLLAPHLTEETGEALLDAARHKSKREVEQLVAALHPQPDIASSIRALPGPRSSATAAPSHPANAPKAQGDGLFATPASEVVTEPPAAAPAEVRGQAPSEHPVVAPLAPGRYLIRMTVSEATHHKLQRARDLLRHVVPDGDPAAIVDRALTVLLQQAELRKFGAPEQRRTSRPRVASAGAHSRVVPTSIRRAVWSRDQGRCAFEGSEGRCVETGGLEFHHVVPFASGGPTTVENLQLRCRAHNAFEGRQIFGDWRRRTGAKRGAGGRNSVQTELGMESNH